jgi:hypothetical protein
MPDRRRKRPRDPAQLAKLMIDIASATAIRLILKRSKARSAATSTMRCWSKYMGRLAKAKNATIPRDSLFQSGRYAPKGAPMAKHSKERTPAEAQFKRRQKAQRATESEQAMADYVAAGHAVRAKTARLKELRLAKEAADKKGKTKQGTKSK